MSRSKLLRDGTEVHPQITALRRSPRFFIHPNAHNINESGRSNSRNSKVTSPHLQSPKISQYSTGKTPHPTIPCTSSLGPTTLSRKPARLSASADDCLILRRSPRFSSLQRTPEISEKKIYSEGYELSDFKVNSHCLGVNQNGDDLKEWRRSLRLTGSAMRGGDSVEVLGDTDSSGLSQKRNRQERRSSNLQKTPRVVDNKIPSTVSDFSANLGFSGVTQNGDGRKGQRRSLRLMDSAMTLEDSVKILEELDYSELSRKGGSQEKRSFLKRTDDCGVILRKGDSSEAAAQRGDHEKRHRGGDRKERRRSLRLIQSAVRLEGVVEALGHLDCSELVWKGESQEKQSFLHSADDCSIALQKEDSLKASKKGNGLIAQRCSRRLMDSATRVGDSIEDLGEADSLKLARRKKCQEKQCFLKGTDDSSVIFRDVDYRKQQIDSVRLMDSDNSIEGSIDLSVKQVSLEETQKGDYRKDQRSVCRLASSAKGAKKSSGLSKDQAFVGTSEKKNFQNEHRSPVRLMDSTNGVEKLEIGVNECNNLEKENDGRKVDNVFSTTLLPREGEKKKRKIDGANEVAGVIEKRSEQTVEGCNFQEWTKDQEVALRRAYFAAKPSPHFWKKVSKLVPGKSAQECFDKIHSERETPTPQPHSRTRKMNFSPLNRFKLSGSKLLHSNGKKTKSYKQKALAHKTARHLLEKHHLANQGYGADLFSVLETATDLPSQAPQSKMPITPDCILKPRCYEKSSSSISKTLSKTMTLRRMDLPSPPVLKQVKNMALA